MMTEPPAFSEGRVSAIAFGGDGKVIHQVEVSYRVPVMGQHRG
jgi:hypothetical protein